MKRTILFLTILLWTVPALATGGPPPPLSEDEFLSSLSRPEPVFLRGEQTDSTCTVTLRCDVGAGDYTVSCSSPNGNCTAGGDYVECDGARSNCPICYVSFDCCHDGSDIIDCYGFSSCSRLFRRVVCDGTEHVCGPAWRCD
jgi:hypothetical protein